MRRDKVANWCAAVLLGLISSSFSTLISQLAAARIGRDALVDWMTVANIPLRDSALSIEPTTVSTVVGILFHQWADFSWALFFFGFLGRFTARLRPTTLLLIAFPWAVLTSATEWFFLVPLVPFWQPVFPLEQPYWIGFLVHLSSALIYPFFPWLRDCVTKDASLANAQFATHYGVVVVAGMIAVISLAILGSRGFEIPWHGTELALDRAFIRRMSAHHAQGIVIAEIGVDRAADPQLRALARLMAAEQIGENKIFAQWWTSWFNAPVQICSSAEQASMPGMLSAAQLVQLKKVASADFDSLFIQLMTLHHLGAVQMAEDELQAGADLRLLVMAEAIRHGQQGEIELMRGTRGTAAVRAATLDLFSARLLHSPHK